MIAAFLSRTDRMYRPIVIIMVFLLNMIPLTRVYGSPPDYLCVKLNSAPTNDKSLYSWYHLALESLRLDPLAIDTFASETKRQKVACIALGTGTIAAQYIACPILAFNVWWSAGLSLQNPLANIQENEPYLEDDVWHFISCNFMSELNYMALRRCFHIRETPSVIVSSCMTFAFYTGIESFDAMEKSGKWGFSVNDEVANVLGIGFWILKHYYPGLPVFVRLGVRQWNDALKVVERDLVIFSDYDRYYHTKPDHYAIMKTEVICKVYNEAYLGIALSKRETSRYNENLWGYTIGFDLISFLNSRKKGWWNFPVYLFTNHISSGLLEFTYWNR